jgi:subtilisin-like proprotein convertase family protein
VQSPLLAFAQTALPAGQSLTLGLFADAAPATIQQIQQLGGQIFAEDNSPFGPIVRVIPPQNWTALAVLPGVQIVEPFRKRALANDLARVTLGVSATTTDAHNYTNITELTGKNVLVEMNDTGVDGDPTTGHPDLRGRVFGDAVQSLVDTNGHGTHVAGIIMGDGTKSTTVTNAQGSINPGVTGQYRGKAQDASLFIVGGIEGGADTNSISDSYLQEEPALTNALISNNSWGYDGDNTYDLAAASYDAAVRDALPTVTGSQPVLFVFAAGNDGGGDDDGGGGISDSIQSPATAKNVITVGATEQFRNITNSVTNLDGSVDMPWQPMTDTSSQVAGYSSRGNVGVGIEGTAGRFKPDVVAPGTFVISTRSQQWDTNSYFDPTNLSESELSDEVDPGSENFYSVSVPSNAVQLTIQVVRNGQSPDPLPAMPIYVWNGTDPRVAPPLGPETNIFIIPTNSIPLNPVGTVWQYAVSNSVNESVNYNLIVDILTTNDLGDYYDVLHALDDTLGTGPPYYYRYETGTSMAAPAVSGVLALMQDFFTNQWQMLPSPALMKAMIINGARQTANYSFQVQNSINFQGWGLVNLPDSLPVGITTNLTTPTPCSSFILDQNPSTALATGDSQTFFVTVTNAQAVFQPLRVTLAWTDPPGNPAAAVKLVNNLDLVVSNMDTGSIVYYGNDISSGTYNTPENTNSPPNLDSINNVENVFISPPVSGHYSVTVVGRDVNVNAVTAQTNNSAGVYAPNVVQDYALVISSGDGAATNTSAIIVTTNNPSGGPSFVSNPTGDQQITFITATNAGVLLNQFVGANTPLLGTSTLLLTNNTTQGFSGSWQVTIGMTNQWHFYVVTNNGATSDVTNAAFVTFESETLAIPRTGVFADSETNATQPEADIDLYVSTDPTLTNLNPNVISNCVNGAQVNKSVGGKFSAASLSRGGTEFVVDTNSIPGQVYYVGVKSETQEASEYEFISIFSAQPFSSLDGNGNEIVNGQPVPIDIPDGSPALPGVAHVIGIALQPVDIGRVVVTNQIWHQNFGDLIGSLSHDDATQLGDSVVLNNHDSLGNTYPPNNGTFIYDDSGEGAVANSQPSDGPGSLQSFIGQQGQGVWLLTEADDSLTQTGSVRNFNMVIQPNPDLDLGVTNLIAPNTWFYAFIDVPPGATNLSISATNLTIPPSINPPVKLFVRLGGLPTLTNTDEVGPVPITNGYPPNPPGGTISIGPPLTSGRYFVGVYNPSGAAQTIFITATLGLGAAAQTDFTSSGPVPILDDAVTTATIPVDANQIISSVNVGINVNHPRISDLVFHLISPDGTRILLMENRGGTSASGAGGTPTITTNTVSLSDFDGQPAQDYPVGAGPAGWTVVSNQVSVVTDPTNAYGGGSNFLALANGTILNSLPTVAGQTYTLTFTYRGPGIVGWWRGENNYLDSAAGNNPSAVQSVTFTNGKVGNAFNFDGSSSYITMPASASLAVSNLTFEGWIFPTTSQYEPIIDYGGANQGSPVHFWVNGYGLTYPVPGALYGNVRNASFTKNLPVNTPGGIVPLNQWSHVAMTLNATAGIDALFYNGSLEASNSTNTSFVPSTYTPVNLGYRDVNSSELLNGSRFAGRMDEFSIYNRVLSLSEIKAIYQAGSAGKFDTNVFNISPTESLAEASIAIPGISTNMILGNNTTWQTTTIPFTATQNGTALQITGLEPGVLLDAASLSSVTTNYSYLTFTENTNLTTTPIKFAVPPFVPGATDPVAWHNGFEGGTANAALITGDYFAGGWVVDSGSIDLVTNDTWGQTLAYDGIWFVDMDGYPGYDPENVGPGEISTNISTVAGQSYMLSFAYSRNFDAPFPPSMQILINGNSLGTLVANVNSTSANNDWQLTNYIFTATSTSTLLAFNSLDPASDSYGVLLDDVSLSDLDYLPEQPMTPLTGLNAQGNWTLEIQDDRAGDNLNASLASWQLGFTFTTGGSTTGSLNNDSAQTNFIPGDGSVDYYAVTVPANADIATNTLLFASAPLNVWFDTNSPPTTNIQLLPDGTYPSGTNGTVILNTTNTSPRLMPGSTYYLGVQNTNSFTVNYALEVNFHLIPEITNSAPATNSVPTNSISELFITVPTNAIYASNILVSATGPINVYFNQTNPPTGNTSAGDFLELPTATNGTFLLTSNSVPPLVPGASYYLGMQNPGTNPVTFVFEVLFGYASQSVQTNITVSSITSTNIGGTNGIWIVWDVSPNGTYYVQYTTNLESTNWFTATTNGIISTQITSTNGTVTFFDDGSLTGGFGLLKFYRLATSPSGTASLTFSISSAEVTAGGFQLQWTAPTNDQFKVEWTANLTSPVTWTTNATIVTSTSGTNTFTDSTWTSAVVRFYRVILLP